MLSLILIALLPPFLCGLEGKKGKRVGWGKRETSNPLEWLQDALVKAQVEEAGAPHWA